MPESMEASLVRIHTADGSVIGAGFLVGERQVLTCAHVITQALDLANALADPPLSTVVLDFPLLAPQKWLRARIVLWCPVLDDSSSDIAGLELLDDPPPGAEVVRFAPAEDVWEHSFRAFGFPAGHDDGVWATGRLLGRQATNWIHIEDVKTEGFAVMPGFSGGPVWDTLLQGVVGMVVASSRRADTKTAFVIPLDVLVATWPLVGPVTRQTRPSRQVKEHLRLTDLYQRRLILVWTDEDEGTPSSLASWRDTVLVDARTLSYETTLATIEAALRQSRSLSGLLGPPVAPPEHEPRNPYKGLFAFTEHDTGDFFGRDTLIDALATTVETLHTHEQQEAQSACLLAVIGPSGSGKSSVVMAGLLPCLHSGRVVDSKAWIYLDPMFPGAHPLENLAVTLARQFPSRSVISLRDDLASDSVRALHLLAAQLVPKTQSKVVLIVDQFEEVFTLTSSEEERQHFFDLLITAATEPHSPLVLILTLRADFSGRLMQYSELYRLIDQSHVSILPMQIDELRSVIEQPAALPDVQLTFEGSLVGDLLFEMQGQAGALPLLQFTLNQLFERRNDRQLTLQAYHAMGGVKGALSQHAEQIYQELPSEEHRTLARALFLRLIDPGITEQETTRRRAALSEFELPDAAQTRRMHETLERFVKARLLTTNQMGEQMTIEVSHEAVIREWKRLADWLREAREDIHFQQAFSEDVTEWTQRGRPTDRLYRGSQLAEIQMWAQRNMPSQNEAVFLQASVAEEEQKKRQEQERQKRELTLQRRVVSRQRWLVIVLSLFSVAMIILTLVANAFRLQAVGEATSALLQARIALSHALSANARFALSQNELDQTLLLSVKALQTANNYEARSSLLQALEYSPHINTMLRTDLPNTISTLEFTSLKDIFVSANDNEVYIWDVSAKGYYSWPLISQTYGADIISVAASPTEPILATVGEAGVWLWDIRTEGQVAQLEGKINNLPADAPHLRLLPGVEMARWWPLADANNILIATTVLLRRFRCGMWYQSSDTVIPCLFLEK
jgi:hypothetical protein